MRFRRALVDSPNSRSTGRTLRLTSKLPVILFVVLLLNQIFNPARIWVGIILGLAVVLGMSYLWASLLCNGLSARRHLSGAWVLAGDMLTETFVVENDSGMPAMWVEVIDHSELPGYRGPLLVAAGPDGHRVRSGGSRADFLFTDVAGFAARYPAAARAGATSEGAAALAIATADPAAAARIPGAVPDGAGGTFVPAAAATGVLLHFRA